MEANRTETDRYRIRLHDSWGHHWWITRVTGTVFESLDHKEAALIMKRNEAERLLRMIVKQCPNAQVEPAHPFAP